jgi:hypothetical protein
MNVIEQHFNKPRVLLAVIHITNRSEGLRSAIAAIESGADGLFFVSGQDLDANVTEATVKEVWKHFGGLWLGINYLGIVPRDAAARLCSFTPCSGLWTDDAMKVVDDPHDTEVELGDHRIYFGGTAFKYTEGYRRGNATTIARHASYDRGIDVVTTSGPATGIPASLGKVRRFREGVGDRALALASGITSDNVETFLPYVDAFLVGTGIESVYGRVDGDKVRALTDKIHGYGK